RVRPGRFWNPVRRRSPTRTPGSPPRRPEGSRTETPWSWPTGINLFSMHHTRAESPWNALRRLGAGAKVPRAGGIRCLALGIGISALSTKEVAMHKKRLIAAVAGGMLAAPAAFAQITISGTVKDGFEIYKLGAGNAATPAASYHYEPRVSDQSSRIIFSGTQDLGGGTRAWFQLDSRFQSDVGGSTQTNAAATTGINLWAGGNTGVGLVGNWGKLTIG